MKRTFVGLALLALLVTALPAASAGPTAGGLASDNVEYVTFVPFETGTATGANIRGKYMYLTSWKNLSIYDISDPANPALVGTPTPLGFMFENENVATNGEILLFSESLPNDILHVWNVEDKSNPVEIAQVEGAGNHTTSCLLDCRWAYGSEGAVTDLRDPENAELVGNWIEHLYPEGMAGTKHDVTEVAPGLVLSSSNPMVYLDARKDPVHPKLLANGVEVENFIHSAEWPSKGKDRFILTTGETWTPVRESQCDDETSGFASWDATKWRTTHTFKPIDIYRPQNGTNPVEDGNPPVNEWGCSTHWFQHHRTFHNGGLVAVAMYSHGTRFLDVDSKGKISEVGWFLPFGGGTSAAYWASDEIVYAVDYQRGLDVLRFTGKV